ncbi:Arm DNA-binding domain-containing protein, partial [Acinetobacter baumannii]
MSADVQKGPLASRKIVGTFVGTSRTNSSRYQQVPLSDTAIRNAKPSPDGKDLKLSDGGGLFLLIKTAGQKYWRMNYRFLGKQKTLAVGVYPLVSLKEARELREAAKRKLLQGIDPSE